MALVGQKATASKSEKFKTAILREEINYMFNTTGKSAFESKRFYDNGFHKFLFTTNIRKTID